MADSVAQERNNSLVEKAIKGLECCRRGFCFACPYNDGVDENTECRQKWADDVLAVLKAQIPRVLTLEEAEAIEPNDVVWLEIAVSGEINPRIVGCVINGYLQFTSGLPWGFESDKYGTHWRVWNAKPTDEQRKEVKWDG